MHTTTPIDPETPDRTAQREDDALRRLYAANAAALRAYVRQYTTDVEADDIVQETFIRAWRHLDRLDRDDRPARPWLIQVARRLLIDASPHGRRRPMTVSHEYAGVTVAVDGGLDRVLDRHLLVQALKRLPQAQLQVVVESWICGET